MRRKHRVIVEVTFDRRVTAKHARDTINNALQSLEISAVDNLLVKEAERVIQAELRNRWRVLTSRNSADRLGQPDGESS